MRVHEIAKQLGMESRVVIPELVRLGIQVTSHSNAVEDDAARWAMDVLQGKIPAPKGISLSEGIVGKAGMKKAGGRLLKKDGVASGRGGAQVEPPKPEKKHILIKKKKTEEELAAEAEAEATAAAEAAAAEELASRQVANEEKARIAAAAGESTLDSQVDGGLPGSDPLQATVASDSGSVVVDAATPSQPQKGQESHPPVLPSGTSSEKDKKSALVDDEKGSIPKKDGEVDDKAKKTKKGPRLKNDEMFAARFEDAAVWQDLRPLPTLRREERVRQVQPTSAGETTKPRKKVIKVPAGLSVKDFAEVLGQKPAEIIRKLMDLNVVKTLNQPMDIDAGILIAEGYGIAVEAVVNKGAEALLEDSLEPGGGEQWESRSPIVTVMGHVDHGKTSLLDAIRNTQVTNREAGGITQHIGASFVQVGEKSVTFIDTPGHEAFTSMRARGAQATDIVVLVVAADDGPMPQTIEAVNHAQAANVPIIVAINKIDLPGANPDRVKQGLADLGLLPESWGGQTIYVEVSAKEGQGLDNLLDMVLLQAEVMELKADVACSARGVVLEAKLDKGRGPVATVLVQGGTLKVGQTFVVGAVSGRVRGLTSDQGARLKEVGPSMAVEVIGLLGVPEAGDQLVVVKDERAARGIAQDRLQKIKEAGFAASSRPTLEDLFAESKDGEVKQLVVLLKTDAHGSAGALGEALHKISTDAVKLKIIHSGVGGINESDVLLAAASQAIIIGFHVRPDSKAANIAAREGVEIRLYTIIYNVLDDVRAAAEGLLAPTIKERVLGHAEVRELFSVPKMGVIAGCYVNDGTIVRTNTKVRVIRDQVTVYEGKIGSLRRFKDDAKEVQQGYECGIGIENFNDIKLGDVFEAYVLEEEATKL